MKNLKKKIRYKLKEGIPTKKQVEVRLKDLNNVVSTELGVSPDDAKDVVAGLVTHNSDVNEAIDGSKVVQYDSQINGEEPFTINGVKWEYVNAIYPNGRKDIGVYRFDHDMTYDYNWFMDEIIGNIKKYDISDAGINKDTFHTEGDDAVSRGISVGMNPEVEADKYEEYRELMAQLASEEDNEQVVNENNYPRMTKKKLIETVTGKVSRNVLRTVKVKDIK